MERPRPEPPQAIISKARLETLFDGIFAIAMTLLVLEVRVPDLPASCTSRELLSGIRLLGPTLLSYGLSFVILGNLWFRHNQMNRHVERVTTPMFALELVQMAVAAFFPFCAALLGRYPHTLAALLAYTGSVMLYQWAQALNWHLANRAGALRGELEPAERRRLHQRNLRGCLGLPLMVGLYLLAHHQGMVR